MGNELSNVVSMDQVHLHVTDCLVKVYIELCNQTVETKNIEELENKLLPKVKELDLKSAEETGISCQKKIYLKFCEEAGS